MKNIIAAIVLTTASNIAVADGFAPWQERAAIIDAAAGSVGTVTATSAFAPWRDHTDLMDMHDSDPRVGVVEPGHFRPWS